MWRETIKLRLAWSLLFILWGKFSAMVNHYAVEHDLQKYSRALCASVPLLYWKIMGLYPIKNCIKSLKYYMHFTGISLIRLFCMCRCWQHTEKRSSDWLLPLKSSRCVWYRRCTQVCTLEKGTFSPHNLKSWQKYDGREIFWNKKSEESSWKPVSFFNDNCVFHIINLLTFVEQNVHVMKCVGM